MREIDDLPLTNVSPYQLSREDGRGVCGMFRGFGRVAVLGVFDWPLRHFAFDDAGVGA